MKQQKSNKKLVFKGFAKAKRLMRVNSRRRLGI